MLGQGRLWRFEANACDPEAKLDVPVHRGEVKSTLRAIGNRATTTLLDGTASKWTNQPRQYLSDLLRVKNTVLFVARAKQRVDH
jgi:hypothetical protein